MAAQGLLSPTPVSLLARLKERPRGEDWARFVDIYGPVIFTWTRRRGLQSHDAADLTQEVLAAVAGSIGRWQQDPERGPFRAWLWTLTRNKLVDYWRTEERQPRSGDPETHELLNQLESRDGPPAHDWDETYQSEVLARALGMLRGEFSDRTWQAFQKVVLEDLSPQVVAAQLGMSLNAVYVAKSRVLGRLRSELEGLMD